jgi:hypothetical protein
MKAKTKFRLAAVSSAGEGLADRDSHAHWASAIMRRRIAAPSAGARGAIAVRQPLAPHAILDAPELLHK